jgi:hypothetical protein
VPKVTLQNITLNVLRVKRERLDGFASGAHRRSTSPVLQDASSPRT